MGCLPSSMAPLQLEEQEIEYPSPNIDSIVEQTNKFFAAENLKVRRSRTMSLGGYHAIIELIVDINAETCKGEDSASQRQLVARVDFPFQALCTDKAIAVPWKLASEVATMQYVKERTAIPIPRIYFYDEDADGKVGGAWMLMEYVNGDDLQYHWQTMSRAQKQSICCSIADYWNQLLSLRFDAIGSLHFDDSGEIKVGPLSMMCSLSTTAYDYPSRDKCGPFATTREWIMAEANGDFRYKTRIYMARGSKAEGEDRQENRRLFIRDTVSWLSELPLLHEPDTYPTTLCPSDFGMHNVMVSRRDPTEIVAVIDWEGTQTVPIWNIHRPSFFGVAECEEQVELDAMLWEKVGSLNATWSESMASGRYLRNAAMRASLSDWDPASYTLEMS
ncbi:hypothetical protein B0H15DRAFT_830573, partial [Mycena belliarum]